MVMYFSIYDHSGTTRHFKVADFENRNGRSIVEICQKLLTFNMDSGFIANFSVSTAEPPGVVVESYVDLKDILASYCLGLD